MGKVTSIKLGYTRSMVTAALNGSLAQAEYRVEPAFGLNVPVSCPGVPSEIMDVRQSWKDTAKYDETANMLAGLFEENIKKYAGLKQETIDAGPKKEIKQLEKKKEVNTSFFF